jgi:hypothetical protein
LIVSPLIENTQDESYPVIVNLRRQPVKNFHHKPKPDSVSGNKIIWNNPKTKTIYAVFGDDPVYQAELTYHLKTNKYTRSLEIAFPPDTIYQKSLFNRLVRSQVSYQDEDGNYQRRRHS